MDETQWDDYLSRLEDDEPTVAAALREMMADRRNLEAQGFLETSLVKAPEREQVGTQVGAYTITSLIGRGGMELVAKLFASLYADLRRLADRELRRFPSAGVSPATLVHGIAGSG
jgi:hypothetical protein